MSLNIGLARGGVTKAFEELRKCKKPNWPQALPLPSVATRFPRGVPSRSLWGPWEFPVRTVACR